VKERYRAIVDAVMKEKDSSYGMAKLYVSLPKHQFEGLQEIIDKIPIYTLPSSFTHANHRDRRRRSSRRNHPSSNISKADSDQLLSQRIKTFRQHQESLPLPVDSVERKIPHDVSVTIVRGGTGSGKVRKYTKLAVCWLKSRTLQV
jgi:hypothetical protein